MDINLLKELFAMSNQILKNKLQKNIRENNFDSILDTVKIINEESWYEVSSIFSRMTLLECYARANNKPLSLSDFNKSKEELIKNIYESVSDIISEKIYYLLPLSLNETIVGKEDLMKQGYTHFIELNHKTDNFIDFLEENSISYLVDDNGLFSFKLNENDEISHIENFLNCFIVEADDNNINAARWPTDTKGQYKAVNNLLRPDYSGNKATAVYSDDNTNTDDLNDGGGNINTDGDDEITDDNNDDEISENSYTKKQRGKNRNLIAKDLSSDKYHTRVTKTAKETKDQNDEWSRKAKHKISNQEEGNMNKNLKESIVGGLNSIPTLNRIQELAGIVPDKDKNFGGDDDDDFDVGLNDISEPSLSDSDLDDYGDDEFNNDNDDYDDGDFGGDEFDNDVENSGIDSVASTDTFSEILTNINKIRSKLTDIRLSEYNDVVHEIQSLYDEIVSVGKTTYMGS